MKESAVLDRIYYDLAKGAYRNDLGKNYEIKDYTDQKSFTNMESKRNIPRQTNRNERSGLWTRYK